jgi:hypothetical protein
MDREFVFFLLYIFVGVSQLGLLALFIITIFDLKKYRREIGGLEHNTEEQGLSGRLSVALRKM